MDQPWEPFGQRFMTQSPSLQCPRLEVLHQDVRVREQGEKRLPPGRLFQIELDAALVAVDRVEIGRGVAGVGRSPGRGSRRLAGGSTLITSAPWSPRIWVQ